MSLRNCVVDEDSKRGLNNFIVKTVQGIDFPLEAENEQDKKDWIEAFKLISQGNGSNPHVAPTKSPSQSSTENLSSEDTQSETETEKLPPISEKQTLGRFLPPITKVIAVQQNELG